MPNKVQQDVVVRIPDEALARKLKAAETGIKANPSVAVFAMPGPTGYMGGDIVSGLLFADFHRQAPLTLLIDIGTNGEIVLGNEDWLITAACSAGPAFEGGEVRWPDADREKFRYMGNSSIAGAYMALLSES